VRPGSITGVLARSSATRVAGTATIEVLKNDVATGLTAVINGTDTVFKGTTQALGTDTFVLGDVIAVKWTTDASWDPTTADFTVMVEVNY
jgi:predicted Zn-dependent protease